MDVIVVFSIVLAFGIPILFLLFLRRYDLIQTGKPERNIATVICGIFAYWLASKINPAIVNAGWGTWDQVIRIYAPFVEEILKSLIILYLVSRADSNYIVDGAIYGFGAGIGFAIIENVEYITNNSSAALVVALARVFSTNLVHATGSGLIGTALAYQRGDKNWARGVSFVFAGYAFAIFFHALFNTMVNAGTFIVVAIIYGFLGFGLIYYFIQRGMKIQKEVVGQTLGDAERITQQETKVIRYIETVDKVLEPIKERFGADKAQMIRTMMFKQAEIGIKKKLLESDTNANRKVEVQKIIDTLLEEMEDLRDKIGWNCMLLYRQVYAGQDLQVWSMLNARVASAGMGQKGGGVWNTLSEKMSQPASQEENQL